MKKEAIISLTILVLIFTFFFLIKEKISQSPSLQKISEENSLKSVEEISQITLEGKLVTIVIDYFEEGRSETDYYLTTEEGENYKLNFNSPIGKLSGINLEVNGRFVKDYFEVSDFSILETEEPLRGGENPNLGEQRLAVVLVNFQDNPLEPMISEEARDIVFNASNNDSINTWINTVSYGRTWLTGDVHGWYTLQLAGGWCSSQFGVNYLDVVNLTDEDIDYQDYQKIMILFPREELCPWGGYSSISPLTVDTNDGIVEFSISVINGVENLVDGTGIHEIGHTFGLFHSEDLECGEESIVQSAGNSLSPACNIIGYGNQFDIMGNSSGMGHFNAYQMDLVGWFVQNNVLIPNGSGEYHISPLELGGQSAKTIKIPRADSEDFFYLEYRRPLFYDSLNYLTYGPEIFDGVFINTVFTRDTSYYLVRSTLLLDMSPHVTTPQYPQTTDSLYSPLVQGQPILIDGPGKVGVELTEINDSSAIINLTFYCGNGLIETSFEDCEGNNLNGHSCGSLGYLEGGTLGCTNTCLYDETDCILGCGNGIVENGEQCDGTDMNDYLCQDICETINGRETCYESGSLICGDDCNFNTNYCDVAVNCPEDLDRNGVVNAADRGYVSPNIGCDTGVGNILCDLADVDGNGFVNAGDRGFISAAIGVCPVCGNNQLDEGEYCDGNIFSINPNTGQPYSCYSGGHLVCFSNCLGFSYSLCE